VEESIFGVLIKQANFCQNNAGRAPIRNFVHPMLNTIEEAIQAIALGEVIIVVDDEDRENEGDFVAAASKVNAEMINFMATHGRGLICAPLPEERCQTLELTPMVTRNTTSHQTPFTVSVDYLGEGCSTGISAPDRARTIQALMDHHSRPEDFGRPGHIFPLMARKSGVLRRAGHTEAAVDFARLAGLEPGGVICEIMNPDGSMARLPDLRRIADQHGLPLVSIQDLIAYRLRTESLVQRLVEVDLPTVWGDFKLIAFGQEEGNQEHLALVKGNWDTNQAIPVRVHSSCMTGDIFGSCRCDCGPQLHKAMEIIHQRGQGVILYMNQEGRGIGLINKLKAYQLQEQGMDTVEANLALGFGMDERDYGIGAQILRNLGVHRMELMTNNPTKRAGLVGYGLEVVSYLPIPVEFNPHNLRYLTTKRDKMGHDIQLPGNA
jgi:3,4-dihydroxy 2-butanone 4-phosphate synthase/GTP cyclohydrolase II